MFPRRHGTEVRRRAVELLRGGMGMRRLAAELGIPLSIAREWCHGYRAVGEEAIMGGTRKTYDFSTRLSAARAHVDEGVPIQEVMRRFGITGDSSLKRWCRLYREGGAEALEPGRRGRPAGSRNRPKPAPSRDRRLEEENEFLRAKVALLEKLQALREQGPRAAH